MNDEINWLVTVLNHNQLLKCALQVKRDALPGDCAEYPMMPENREVIHDLPDGAGRLPASAGR